MGYLGRPWFIARGCIASLFGVAYVFVASCFWKRTEKFNSSYYSFLRSIAVSDGLSIIYCVLRPILFTKEHCIKYYSFLVRTLGIWSAWLGMVLVAWVRFRSVRGLITHVDDIKRATVGLLIGGVWIWSWGMIIWYGWVFIIEPLSTLSDLKVSENLTFLFNNETSDPCPARFKDVYIISEIGGSIVAVLGLVGFTLASSVQIHRVKRLLSSQGIQVNEKQFKIEKNLATCCAVVCAFVVFNKIFNTIEELHEPGNAVIGTLIEMLSDFNHLSFVVANPITYLIYDGQIRKVAVQRLSARGLIPQKAANKIIPASMISVAPASAARQDSSFVTNNTRVN